MAQDPRFTARDLLKLAGLTYRQLNDWESRVGISPSERATSEGWRKFTSEEVLALSVCASLRRELHLTLEIIGGLYQWLMGRRLTKSDETLLAIAETQLESMRSNSKVNRLLNLTGEALKEALNSPAAEYIYG